MNLQQIATLQIHCADIQYSTLLTKTDSRFTSHTFIKNLSFLLRHIELGNIALGIETAKERGKRFVCTEYVNQD